MHWEDWHGSLNLHGNRSFRHRRGDGSGLWSRDEEHKLWKKMSVWRILSGRFGLVPAPSEGWCMTLNLMRHDKNGLSFPFILSVALVWVRNQEACPPS